MRTIIVGASWITKYFIADTLYNDGDFEEYIQVLSPEPIEDFFNFGKLAEFQGDERLNYVQSKALDAVKQGIELEHVDAVYIDNTTDAIGFIEYLGAQNFTKRVVLASSWEVYGWQGRNKVPIDPRTETNPETQLGQVYELEEESLITSKLNYVILRFGHIFGPKMPLDSELVLIATSMFKNEDIVITDVPSRWLDLVYVMEVLPVIKKSLSMAGIDKQIFNVGGHHEEIVAGQPRRNLIVNEKSISNLVRAMRHSIDSQSRLIFEPKVPIVQGKGYHSQLDITTTQKTFSYFPNLDAMKLTQFLWWVESLIGPEKRVKDIDKLYPGLSDEFWNKGDVSELSDAINLDEAQFNDQIKHAQGLIKKDMKVEDVQ